MPESALGHLLLVERERGGAREDEWLRVKRRFQALSPFCCGRDCRGILGVESASLTVPKVGEPWGRLPREGRLDYFPGSTAEPSRP